MNMRFVLSMIPLLFALESTATPAHPDVVGANTDHCGRLLVSSRFLVILLPSPRGCV